MTEILALLATIVGVVTSFGYFPQAIKIIKNKSAKDVSVITYIMFFAGMSIWEVYAFDIKNLPLIIANTAGMLGCGFVLAAYVIYSKKRKQ